MIYFDNAATTWPKPRSVLEGVERCMKHAAANPGRSGHKMSLKAGELLYECRESVADFFGLDNPSGVIFTQNATYALNIVINGILKKGDHVICTDMDHNSVLRPLFSFGNQIDISIAHADEEGFVSADTVQSLIRDNTRLIVMSHVSNVCGTIQPVSDIVRLAKDNDILFLLDASQSAGILDINMSRQGIDFLACPGHKSLYGPMGTGVLCINSSYPLKPLITGGTGSYSQSIIQPDELPDRFESGTLNLPGICGLSEGIKFVSAIGIDNIYRNEMKLISYLIDELNDLPSYKIIGRKGTHGRTGVLSIVHSHKDSAQVASILDSAYNIGVRAMYHCAYMAHEALGTSEGGTVRISLGVFNVLSEIKTLLYALEHI